MYTLKRLSELVLGSAEDDLSQQTLQPWTFALPSAPAMATSTSPINDKMKGLFGTCRPPQTGQNQELSRCGSFRICNQALIPIPPHESPPRAVREVSTFTAFPAAAYSA